MNRVQDLSQSFANDASVDKVGELEQAFAQKHDAIEERIQKENGVLKERVLATERTNEHCVGSLEAHRVAAYLCQPGPPD